MPQTGGRRHQRPGRHLSLRTTGDGVVMPVRVIPRASRTLLAGWRDGRLLVRLTAAPVKGAANEALLTLLARGLKAPRCGSSPANAPGRARTYA